MGGGVKALVLIALAGTISFTFLLLACALPQYGVWWPMFVVAFYALTPIPVLISRNYSEGTSVRDLCVFFATVIIFSSYALPVLLARAPASNPVIKWGACALTMTANTTMFAVIFGVLYITLKNDDGLFST